jgi:hypothetical protein
MDPFAYVIAGEEPESAAGAAVDDEDPLRRPSAGSVNVVLTAGPFDDGGGNL